MADRNTKIRGSQIRDLTITADDIANSTITLNKLVSGQAGQFLVCGSGGAPQYTALGGAVSFNWETSELTLNAGSVSYDTLDSDLQDAIDKANVSISEAPIDGKVYGRKDSDWVEIVTPETAIMEADIEQKVFEIGSGGQSEFTLDNDCVPNSLCVYLNGLLLQKGTGKDYTYNATEKKVTLTAPAEEGDIVIIQSIKKAA